jgi:hypothetical protein
MRIRGIVFSTIALATIVASDPASAALSTADTPKTVLTCYNTGNTTIQQMRDCAGVWVTPRALMMCALQAHCPVLPDTAEGRADLDAALRMEGLSRASSLRLRAADLPRLPDPARLAACKKSTANEDAFTDCVLASLAQGRYDTLRACLKIDNDAERAICLSREAPNPGLYLIVNCLGTQTATADRLVACLNRPEPALRAQKNLECVQRAGASGKARAECLLPGATESQKALADCLAESGNAAARAAECLGRGPGEARAVAGCAASEADAGAVVANCTPGMRSEKVRLTFACIARAGTDQSKFGECAAISALPNETIALVGCAGAGQDRAAFAFCGAKRMIGEPWRVAAECTVRATGETVNFAACLTGSAITREIAKCFSGAFGSDCFGRNSTVIDTFYEAVEGLRRKLGPDNEVVKAAYAVGSVLEQRVSRIGDDADRIGKNPEAVIERAPTEASAVDTRPPPEQNIRRRGGQDPGRVIERGVQGVGNAVGRTIRCVFGC